MLTTKFYSNDLKSSFEVFYNTKGRIAFDVKNEEDEDQQLYYPVIDIEIEDAKILVKELNRLIKEATE